MITDKGNVLFEQGRLSLECRKLYTDVLRKETFWIRLCMNNGILHMEVCIMCMWRRLRVHGKD